MAGLPADYRDRNNENMSLILQAIAAAGLNSHVTVLGMLEDSDLGRLMCTAAVLIQPSLFEGWSLTLQDAKALGRPIICSDIPLHREQVPDALGFFRPDCPGELAELLAENWEDFDSGLNHDGKTRALVREQKFARVHGLRLLDICKEALRQ
jgi:glycosyltransferase involved in cell wall biosynthesis